MLTQSSPIDLVVMGVSSGGLEVVTIILSNLNEKFSIPIAIVQHVEEFSDNYLVSHLRLTTRKRIKEAEDKESIQDEVVYVAPSSHHLLIEYEKIFSLNEDPRVNYARPSIDVLFESAADAYNNKIIGILLTGSNSDGAKGLKKIQENGGYTLVQSPDSCISSEMPESALTLIRPDQILTPLQISDFLNKVDQDKKEYIYGAANK